VSEIWEYVKEEFRTHPLWWGMLFGLIAIWLVIGALWNRSTVSAGNISIP
jgi:hypothetical protein